MNTSIKITRVGAIAAADGTLVAVAYGSSAQANTAAAAGPPTVSTKQHLQPHSTVRLNSFPIVTNLDNMCLSVEESNSAPGAGIDMEHCNGTPAQGWAFGANGNLVSALNSGLCLDDRFNNPAGGAGVDIYNCNPWAAQNWRFNGNELVNANGLCLDVINANNSQGAGVQLFTCGGNSNQQWFF